MKNCIFKGSGTAMITPFSEDDSINYEEIERIIENQIENGTDAIIACGTTAESATLTEQEHLDVIKFVIEKVKGRIPVIAGTGSNDSKFCLELSIDAKNAGADALLIVTPYYNKTSQKGLIEHYNYVANNVKMPIIAYNVPSRTGLNILPETYYELSKNEYIVAAKEANGNIPALTKTISMCGDDFSIYSGDDILTYPIMTLGGKGVISVMSNALPKVMHDITAAILNGDFETGRKLSINNYDIEEALTLDVNPMPIKEMMNQMGYNAGKCRMPLTSMSDDAKAKISAVLKKHNLI